MEHLTEARPNRKGQQKQSRRPHGPPSSYSSVQRAERFEIAAVGQWFDSRSSADAWPVYVLGIASAPAPRAMRLPQPLCGGIRPEAVVASGSGQPSTASEVRSPGLLLPFSPKAESLLSPDLALGLMARSLSLALSAWETPSIDSTSRRT